MLTREDNELVTRVGPGTPLGRLMREYWLPFLLSEELPAPDSSPLRIRLLSEDLVAFRATDGTVGLVGNHCPHRGASLFFGRNEENGIRCVYHGWKFDVSGACVDMPNEPSESNFKHKVRVTVYPCRERNGIVWTYMGPRARHRRCRSSSGTWSRPATPTCPSESPPRTGCNRWRARSTRLIAISSTPASRNRDRAEPVSSRANSRRTARYEAVGG